MSQRGAVSRRSPIRPIVVTTATLAFRYGLFSDTRRYLRDGVFIVAPSSRPATAACLRRVARMLSTRYPTTFCRV